MSAKGYDSPRGRTTDRLSRRAFAHEIAQLATSAPAQWAVRIGIYGEWGSGKSSVLEMVREEAEERGHLVVQFNAWRYRNSAEAWPEFARQVSRTLESAGLDSEAASRTWARGSVALLAQRFRSVADSLGVGREFDALAEKLGPGSGHQDLREAIADRPRLVVLVDDLDRTAPQLVPDLLHGIRQILDLPGLSFVLALDPRLVGAALKAAYGTDEHGVERFLEKIIDFPRRLPTASRTALARLVIEDVKQHVPEIPDSAVSLAAPYLPTTPRAARLLARELWSLASEIRRYDDDEVSWALLTRVTLLQMEFPSLAEAIAEGAAELEWLAARNALRNARVDLASRESALSELIGAHVDARQVTRARDLVESIFVGDAGLGGVRRSLHLRLRTRPPDVTRREVVDCLGLGEADREEWIRQHAQFRSLSVADVLSAMVPELCAEYERRHRELGSADYVMDANDALRRSRHALEMVEDVLNRLTGLGRLEVDHLKHTWRAVSLFAHWAPEPFAVLREQEDDFLARSLARHDIAPALWLEAVDAWGVRVRDPRDAKFHERFDRVVGAQLRRIAQDVPDLFRDPDRIAIALTTNDDPALQRVLLGPERLLWTPPLRASVMAALALDDHRVSANAGEIFMTLGSIERHGVRVPSEWLALGREDHDLVVALWEAVTRFPVLEIRREPLFASRQVLARDERPLPLPAWWDSRSPTT